MAKYDTDEDNSAKSMKGYDDHAHVLECLSKSQAADKDNREAAREAFLFVNKRDGQWEPFWWSQNAGRPRYTFDVVSKNIKRHVNQIKQASFDIRVQPAGGDASKDVALTYDGLIRNIENISQAKQVYGRTAKGMVTMGFDAFLIDHQYINSDSFDQDLCIKKVNNAVDRVWFDVASEKQDKSDSEHAFLFHAVGTDDYEDRWPDGSGESLSDGREAEAYYDKKETVIVGQVFYAKYDEVDLVLMSNGAVYPDDEKFKLTSDELLGMGVTEEKRRTKKVAKWYTRFFDNSDWLDDEKETVFDRNPLIPAYANYDVFENKCIWFGDVEKQTDSQRVLNYSLSREIEEGALAPRQKYWMTTKQAAGHEEKLATLNTNSDPVQFYNPDPEAPGAPMSTGGAQINPGLRNISMAMQQMIMESSGQFDASQGNDPNQQSGVAIRGLQNRTDETNYDYMESMEIAIAAAGRVITAAIPRTYNARRKARLLYEDGTYEMAEINTTIIDQQTGQQVAMNDLSQGQYDIVCSAGPAFQNRQQETLEFIMEYAKADPSIMEIGGDVMLNSVNSPAAKQLAERKRALMLKQGMIPASQMTEEEKAEMQAAQQAQGQQQDPAMVLAQAEMMKGQADLARAQTDQMKAQAALITAQARAQGVNVDTFEAETERMEAQIEAQKAGATIQKESVSTEGIRLDNAAKVRDIFNPPSNNGGMR